MKFYGTGIVWDRGHNRSLCRFSKNGVLETEDDRIIGLLLAQGYDHDPVLEAQKTNPREIEKTEPVSEKSNSEHKTVVHGSLEHMGINELRMVATSKGIEWAKNMGRDRLLNKIKEAIS